MSCLPLSESLFMLLSHSLLPPLSSLTLSLFHSLSFALSLCLSLSLSLSDPFTLVTLPSLSLLPLSLPPTMSLAQQPKQPQALLASLHSKTQAQVWEEAEEARSSLSARDTCHR